LRHGRLDRRRCLNEYFMLGGTPEGNQRARLDLTTRMLAFLKAPREARP